jgi:hypothetical protein
VPAAASAAPSDSSDSAASAAPSASFEHTLVVGSPVVLDFSFSPPLTGTALPASLAATLNGEPLSLESASFALCATGACGASAGTIRMPFTALEVTEHVFELSTLERTSRFVVPAAAVFTYPTVVTTAAVTGDTRAARPVRAAHDGLLERISR